MLRGRNINTRRRADSCITCRDKMMRIWFWLMSVLLWCAAVADMGETAAAVVRISHGLVRGSENKTSSGAFYYSFRGIPYAKPPVGPLRFKPPEPAEPWEGIRECIEEPAVAPQNSFFTGDFVGNEDCLFINIFTPQIPSEKTPQLMPVLVYIHGGAYFIGSGNMEMHGPARFMNSGDVVLVTMNYRLGALGFLSTGDSVVSGNNGLKDQVLSLRWVQENIENFGGDPNNVVIAGISAGGSSTHLHLFSQLSKGLFHKAIAESGSALAPWSAQDPDEARRRAFRLGEFLGLKTNSSEELVEFLRTLPAKSLVEGTVLSLTDDEKHPLPLAFLPVVERGRDPDSMFLSEKPLTLIKEKKFTEVPLITGVTSKEGYLILRDLAASSGWYKGLDQDLEPVFNLHLNFKKGTAESRERTAKIKEFFFGDKHISNQTWDALIDIYGDIFFNIWADKAAKEQVAISSAPLYFYQFSYLGSKATTLLEKMGGDKDMPITGAFHGAEMIFLFETTLFGDINDLEGQDKEVSDKLLKMWINFAKTGNPTPVEDDAQLGVLWKPFSKTETNYLDINKELMMKTDLFKERMEFWNNLLPDPTFL